jgi:hypothetical protein
MTPQAINYPAVRAYLHCARRMYGQQETDRVIVRTVHPGGYSGRALAVLHALEEQRLASRVAVRFGLTARLLLDQVWEAAHRQDDAIQRRAS